MNVLTNSRRLLVQVSTTVEKVIERLKAIEALSSFFSPVESCITQFHIQITNWCIKNRILVNLRTAMNTKFIAEFLVATYNRGNMFLGGFMKSKMPMNVYSMLGSKHCGVDYSSGRVLVKSCSSNFLQKRAQ